MHTAVKTFTLEVRDLGCMDYQEATAVQQHVHKGVVAGEVDPTLLLVEHGPVITISRRRNAKEHLVSGTYFLERMGIDIQQTNRGGDITYHGPGQLVAYPIVSLTSLGLNIGRYIRFLEQVVLKVAESFGVSAYTESGFTGVWVRGAAGKPLKIGAIGVRVERNVTLHGIALNVTTNLDHYKTIIPCGLADRGVTSMEQQLGGDTPLMRVVKDRFIEVFCKQITFVSNMTCVMNTTIEA